MAAGDIQKKDTMGDLQSMLAIFRGTPAVTTTSTSKEEVSAEKASAYIKQMLESTGGLAAVSSGQRQAGLYNSSTNQLLTNDLLARTAAEAARLSSTKTNTSTTKGAPQLNLGKTVASAGLKYLMNPQNKFSNAKKAYSWLDDMMGGGGGGSSITPMSQDEVFASGQTNSMGNVSDFLASMGDPNVANDGGTTSAASGAADAAGAVLGSMFGESLGGSVGSAAATSGTVGSGSYAVGGTGAWAEGAGSSAAASGAASGAGDVAAAGAAESAVGGAAGEAAAGEAGSAMADGAAAEAGGEMGALGATGWGALAVFGAMDAMSDSKKSSDVKWADWYGGLGTGNIVEAWETGDWKDIAGPAKPLLTNILDETGWIICTELNKQGRLPNRFYIHGAREFAKYDERGKQGYYIWAIPSVKHLKQYPTSRYSKLLERVFNARAEYLSAVAGLRGARKTVLGAVTTHGLYAFCWILSRTIARAAYSNEQILGVKNG